MGVRERCGAAAGHRAGVSRADVPYGQVRGSSGTPDLPAAFTVEEHGAACRRDRSEEERRWEAVIAVIALLFLLFVVLGVVRHGEGGRRRQARCGPHDHAGPPHGRGPHPARQDLRPVRPGGRAGPAAADAAHLDAGHPGGTAGRGRPRTSPSRSPSASSSGSARTDTSWTTNSSAWRPSPTGARSPTRLPGLRERTERITHVGGLAALGRPRPGPPLRRRRPGHR